jgi:hypothetical protein
MNDSSIAFLTVADPNGTLGEMPQEWVKNHISPTSGNRYFYFCFPKYSRFRHLNLGVVYDHITSDPRNICKKI